MPGSSDVCRWQSHRLTAVVGLFLLWGRWVDFPYLPVGGFVIGVVLLNLAQERIEELL
jgi:hypothetical protein